ncbi:hypothetical protein MF271_01155 (plasmid) [Deinococcus sp. KNUC1210]|uniref:hypothetical protein n=1 Tax=Deinococcus sp. KNUC1210 TaxID=2917691 RepID=UPI001EF11913|nr:hypothetical protein [Deinococcus sp. KNUC1210]ULH13968.1 hypothetical protein MF271_01155 [Deinococcus sp. KNUC1210]
MLKRLDRSDMKCQFCKGTGGIIIKDGFGGLRAELTRVYRAMARVSTTSYARAIVSALHRYWVEAQPLGLGFSATIEQVHCIVEQILVRHYHAEISGVTIRRVTAYGNAPTIAGFLNALRKGLRLLAELGERTAEKSFVRYQGARGYLSRHRYVARYGGMIPSEALMGRYALQGPRMIPAEVADGTVIPDTMRAAFERAGANALEFAYFECLVATGARNSEIGSATFASFKGGFGMTLSVRNKGQLNEKTVLWDDVARTAYQYYFVVERLKRDPLAPRFLRWLGRRPVTVELYVIFLKTNGFDLTQVLLFLTRSGEAYTGDTFRRTIWRQANGHLVTPYRPHLLRHVHVNRRLQAIWDEYGATPHLYLAALKAFISEMGWSHWSSVLPYDARGLATDALTAHYRAPRSGQRAVDHGHVGRQLTARPHQPAIHARTRPETV